MKKLQEVITFFKSEVQQRNLQNSFIGSSSAVHCCLIAGNEEVKNAAQKFQQKGFDIKAILSPTVPKGKERLRFCLHSFNTPEELQSALSLLAEILKLQK